jgi:hypothetical protein
MTEKQEQPFIADVDPAFSAMRSEVRVDLRAAEAEFRRILREELLAKVPPELAASLASIDVDMARLFIKGLEPFFAGLNEMLNAAEVLGEALRQHRQTIN